MSYAFSESDFESRVEEIQAEYYSHFSETKSYRLARLHFAVSLCLENEDLSPADIYEQVSDDSADEGIDFFYVSSTDDEPVIYVMQAKDHKSLPNAEQKTAVLRMVAEIRNLIGKKTSHGLNERERSRFQDIREAVKNGKPRISYFLLLTGEQTAKLNESHFSPDDFTENSDLAVLDRASFLELMNREALPVEPKIQILWESADHFEFARGTTSRVLQGYISVKDFVEQTRPWKDSIFRLNPRLFLANKRTGPNAKMLDTLNSNEKDYFHLLNNGVTAVCREFTAKANGMASMITIEDFQIVNGCQTTSTLWNWCKDYPVGIEDVYLSLKIIESSHLASRISLTTNSQNAINFVDLASSSATQIRIKKALEAIPDIPYLYINRRGTWEAQKTKSKYQIREWGTLKGSHHRKIDIREFAQAMIAVTGKPAKAKENLIDVFQAPDVYSKLLDTSWTSGEQIALVADLYLYCSNLDFWPQQPVPDAGELAVMARFYVTYLVYEYLRTSGTPTFDHDSTGWLELIDEARSRQIRRDLQNSISKAAVLAIEAVENVYSTALGDGVPIEKRALVRKDEHRKSIENSFKNMIRISKKYENSNA